MYNQEIVRLVANADLKAFRKMYIDCAPAVYDCAYDILHDVVRANIAVSRTFVDIFNYLPQLKKLSLFDEWVYRLTVYHADNIALEDFIRGSEKLETIWSDIMEELGSTRESKSKAPQAVEETMRKERKANPEETSALYSRLRSIEQEADLQTGRREKRSEPPVRAAAEKPAAEPKGAEEEEEWTPILFPTEEPEAKANLLRGKRKKVYIPSSKVYSSYKPQSVTLPQELIEDEGLQPDNSAKASAMGADRIYIRGESLPMLDQENKRGFMAAEAAPKEEPDEKYDRFRSFLSETRRSETATQAPPPEEVLADSDDEEILLEDAQDASDEQIAEREEEPRKKVWLVVGISVGAIAAMLLVLLLMAYKVLPTPSFMEGVVQAVAQSLMGLFAYFAKINAM